MATDLPRRPPDPSPAGHRFDSWATTYDACSLQPLYQAAHRSLVTVATALDPPPRRILDLGCGTGQLLKFLRQTMPHVTVVGVDASGPMLSAAAATNDSEIRWVRARVEQLPFGTGTFDLVTASFTTRHWTDVQKAAHETARILAPGGMLAVADVFTHQRPGPLAALLRRDQTAPEPLRTAFTEAGLRQNATWWTDGYGPIPSIVVTTAVRDERSSLHCA